MESTSVEIGSIVVVRHLDEIHFVQPANLADQVVLITIEHFKSNIRK